MNIHGGQTKFTVEKKHGIKPAKNMYATKGNGGLTNKKHII